MALYAGTGVGAITAIRPAADLISDVMTLSGSRDVTTPH
jgi:hypothetical protein